MGATLKGTPRRGAHRILLEPCRRVTGVRHWGAERPVGACRDGVTPGTFGSLMNQESAFQREWENMRVTSITAAALGAAVLVVAGSGPSLAGEVTGNGKDTHGPEHANSICAFSGLEDGDDNDDGIPELPYGPGVPPQNWGHVQQFLKGELGLTNAQIKASGEQPGDSCNGHSGFLAGGGGE